MARQSREDLLNHLRVQVAFLRKSGKDFDEGDVSEALRLAVSLRILLHDKGSSLSLLMQLGIKHRLRFLDSSLRPEPAEPGILRKTFSPGLAGISIDGTGARLFPRLDDDNDIRGPRLFAQWWHQWVLEDPSGPNQALGGSGRTGR